MRSTFAFVVMLVASCAMADCIGHPSDTLKGWKAISKWTLPGDVFGVAYVCSGENRKIVVERFTSRTGSDVNYVSDVALPKLSRGELLIGGGRCTRDGTADPYLVPFGMYARNGAWHVRHAWRVELPTGRILPVNPGSVHCLAANERD